jgi:hypothetical protein
MLTDSYINHLTNANIVGVQNDGDDNAVRLACQQWQAIHSGAILMAAAAIAEKSWAHLRQAEDVMSSAQAGFDPLVVAIMGNRAPDFSNRLMQALHQAGTHATADQLAAARTAIKANREQMDARRREKPVRPAVQPTVGLKKDLPPVGAVLVLREFPYSVRKKFDGHVGGFVEWEGETFRVETSAPIGAETKITAQKTQSLYGIKFHLTGEAI